jgi:hypothetical protein
VQIYRHRKRLRGWNRRVKRERLWEGELVFNGTEILFEMMNNSGNTQWYWLYNTEHVLNTIELYTQKWVKWHL